MIKKFANILFGSICLVSVGNSMYSNNQLSDDYVAMQHTILNIMQIKSTNDTVLSSIAKIIEEPDVFIENLFQIDSYNNSPKGNARKFLNDRVAAMVNCNYNDNNNLDNNKCYNELKNIFNTIISIDYSKISSALNKMREILKNTKNIFLNVCENIKKENNSEFSFINTNYKNDDDYRTLQYKLAYTLQQKSENGKRPEFEGLANWRLNEILLHKSLLLTLYCEKLVMDLTLFPKEDDLFSESDLSSEYFGVLFDQFKVNVSQYFKK